MPNFRYRPNIIMINVESMDGRKMGCMGNRAMARATPNLDRLAAEGTLFRRAYTNSPLCNPSRASMWSGRYPHVHNCWNNHEGLEGQVPTFQTRLEEAGYLTRTVGPLDFRYGAHSIRDRIGSWTRSASIHRPLNTSPLPEVVDEEPYGRDWERVYESIGWLNRVKDDERPFMLYLTTSLVHPAFRAQSNYMNMIDVEKIAVPPAGGVDHPVLKYQQVTKNAEKESPDHLKLKVRHVYYAMIATLDNMLGALFRAIDEFDLRDSTYIILTSDHGEMAMEQGQVLKRTMFESSVHIPLIVTGPDVDRGREVELPVSLVDIFPTLMDIARTDAPDDLDGESLLPLLSEKSGKHRDWIFSEYHGDRCNTGTFMLVKESWKYIHYSGYSPVLFNLDEDPWELENVAERRPDVVEEMQGILDGIVDCKVVDLEAKAYDRKNFQRWRRDRKQEGRYSEMMAYIYSGYNGVRLGNVRPWTETEEDRIEEWLDSDLARVF